MIERFGLRRNFGELVDKKERYGANHASDVSRSLGLGIVRLQIGVHAVIGDDQCSCVQGPLSAPGNLGHIKVEASFREFTRSSLHRVCPRRG